MFGFQRFCFPFSAFSPPHTPVFENKWASNPSSLLAETTIRSFMLPGNMHFLKPVSKLPRESKNEQSQNLFRPAAPGCAEGRALEAVGGRKNSRQLAKFADYLCFVVLPSSKFMRLLCLWFQVSGFRSQVSQDPASRIAYPESAVVRIAAFCGSQVSGLKSLLSAGHRFQVAGLFPAALGGPLRISLAVPPHQPICVHLCLVPIIGSVVKENS